MVVICGGNHVPAVVLEDEAMIKILIFGLMIFVVLMVWACCIVAGQADDREERWFERRAEHDPQHNTR